MVKFRYYDKEKRVDYVWYESSNIVYSECDDVEDDYKTLTIVFKSGATYKYRNVKVTDYVMFVRGGLDGSNGKALNKYIKPNYPCERMTDTDLADIEADMRKKQSEAKDEEDKK